MIPRGHTIPVLDHGFVRLVDYMGTDTCIVEAARVSYHSPSKGEEQDKKLLAYLFKNKHTSPFEMAKVKLDIKMPIFIARQFVRHRMQNMNEVSARYTELPVEFYVPKVWRQQDQKNKQASHEVDNWKPFLADVTASGYDETYAEEAYKAMCVKAFQLYRDLLYAGVAREMARMVLPLSTYTQFYTCWDLNNLLKYLFLRDDAHAQWEHQQYGLAIKEILKELFPWTMEIYEQARIK